MELTARQFASFRELVYRECGINLHEGKQQLLQARLSKRLRKTGIARVEDYLQVLASDGDERIRFIDAISTNHTYFFREDQHFALLDARHRRIWCAACSSGEEPYSIAIHCLEQGLRPAILATDISTAVLKIGESGVYPLEKARRIPPAALKKYFKKGHGSWEGYIRLKDDIRRMVTFRRFNLLTDAPPPGEFDLIFCRNVMIYFDGPVKEAVVDRLSRCLKPHGHFIIGGAESLNNVKHRLHYVRPSIYCKGA
jgi:chemotaxis protein methyltransferase CheR